MHRLQRPRMPSEFVRLVQILACICISVHITQASLYEEPGDSDIITELNVSTFDDIVYNENSESTWFIEFYASWCGHCQNFAKTFRPLARGLRKWNPFLHVGVMDCADEINTDICGNHNITGFPTLKIFGSKITKADPEPTRLEGERSIFKLRDMLATYLADEENLPLLETTKSIELGKKPVVGNRKVILFEPKWSSIGRQIKLDLVHDVKRYATAFNFVWHPLNVPPKNYTAEDTAALLLSKEWGITGQYDVFQVEDDAHQLIGHYENFHADNYTTLYAQVHQIFRVDTRPTDSHDIETSKPSESSELPRMPVEIHEQLEPLQGAVCEGIHLEDAINAAFHSLRQEVVMHGTITGKDLRNLVRFVEAVATYLPNSPTVNSTSFFTHVLKYLNSNEAVTSHDLKRKMNEISKSTGWYAHDTWIGCKGSTPKYRGYPCGLWTLFHTLVTMATWQNRDASSVMSAIEGYITTFFMCTVCAENFAGEIVAWKNVGRVGQQIFGTAALGLWEIHNRVNLRLGSNEAEASNDPKHPKVQFPPQDHCEKCHDMHSESKWDRKEVLAFLLHCYAQEAVENGGPSAKFHTRAPEIHSLISSVLSYGAGLPPARIIPKKTARKMKPNTDIHEAANRLIEQEKYAEIVKADMERENQGEVIHGGDSRVYKRTLWRAFLIWLAIAVCGYAAPYLIIKVVETVFYTEIYKKRN